jgi:hypothetical protein
MSLDDKIRFKWGKNTLTRIHDTAFIELDTKWRSRFDNEYLIVDHLPLEKDVQILDEDHQVG